MSPQQPGQLGCLNGGTPLRHLRDERKYHQRNEDGQSLQSTPKSSRTTVPSKGRSCRRLSMDTARPRSVDFFPPENLCLEPISLSTGTSPVNNFSSFLCGNAPYFGSVGVPDQLSVNSFSTPQQLKKRKPGLRQPRGQGAESPNTLADRYASSRYSDSPKPKQLPLPPVDWIDEGSSKDRFSKQLRVSSSEGGSPVFFGSSFSSRSSEDSFSLERSEEFILEDAKVCRAIQVHMSPLKLIEAVAAS